MDNAEYKELYHKLEALYNYQRELARLLKGLDAKDKELASELDKINNRIVELEHKVDLLYKGHNPQQVVSYKSFTPKDIYELKKQMSWSKLAAYLKCSTSTCQRLVREGAKQ